MVMVDRSNFLLSRCGILRIYLSMALLFAALPIVATAQTERRQKGSNGATVSVPPAPNAKTQREPIWVDEISTAKRGDGYFRRVLELPAIEEAFLEFEATETCEVFLNGLRVGTSRGIGSKEKVDVASNARPGKNTLAIRATNRSRPNPSISFGFYFKPLSGKWRIVVSDAECKASSTVSTNWQLLRYDDSKWAPATSRTGANNSLPAQNVAETIATDGRKSDKPQSKPIQAYLADYDSSKGLPPVDRFTTKPGFSVVEVFSSKKVGSILAMAFNEFGHIIASQEDGPLLLLYDADKDGTLDKSRIYCDLVKNIQGILPLNGDVYVTGDGDKGSGLYRLADADRNGELEKSELILRFKGTPGEHGPHQITFGPDGCLYIVVGNHSQLDQPRTDDDTYPPPYEGDLIQPRFEDPGGHAEGIKAPGGTIVRYDLASQKASVIAGGLRNAYDIAFHPSGNLYVHDSDMEADLGATWHRPTGLFKILEGSEFGWRSGWANWPEHYLDRLAPIASAGRCSPTGMVVYNHHMYPTKYHRTLFLADWSEGRILSCNVETSDRSKPKMEDFVVGTPMNVTDIDVGGDGWLYFSTGGRGTDGGIYCVKWTGEIPEKVRDLGDGITKAIRLPQIYSAFGRQAAALAKKEIGSEWGDLVAGVAYSSENPARYRMQALDLMQLLGPVPPAEMLIELSNTTNEAVRAKCARLMGLQSDTGTAERLVKMLSDTSAPVRIAACESMLRMGVICDPTAIIALLQSESREERFLARRILATIPEERWKDQFLSSVSGRLVINASLVLATNSRDSANATMVVNALSKVVEGFVSDADFVDLLRTVQVTLGAVNVDDVTLSKLRSLVESEFPAGNSIINAELIRIATYLQIDLVAEAVKYLQTDTSMPERVLIAMHLPMMNHNWTSKERMALLQFLESAQKERGGGSYHLYVMKTSNAVADFLTEEESVKILSLGEQYPNAALAALLKLPEQLDDSAIERLIKLDSQIDKGGMEEDVFKRLKTGITAILSQQKDESAQDYLRQRWRKSPDRRASIALALAQRPDEKNWDYLVRSMGILDLFAVPDICSALRSIDIATDDPDAIRQTILQGCRLVEAGQNPEPAVALLKYWTGEEFATSSDNPESPMLAWQRWFEVRFPDSPTAVLPSELESPRWSLEFLEQFLAGDQGKYGDRDNGALIFAKAQCSACHKMNTQGSGFGPDLSSVAKRFTRTEFLESTLYPSHVISDQYASKKVLTTRGQVYTGILVKTPSGVIVRTNQEKEIQVPQDEIEEIMPSKISAMPSGLLDMLTPTEIRNLLCYFGYIPQEQIAEKSAPLRR